MEWQENCRQNQVMHHLIRVLWISRKSAIIEQWRFTYINFQISSWVTSFVKSKFANWFMTGIVVIKRSWTFCKEVQTASWGWYLRHMPGRCCHIVLMRKDMTLLAAYVSHRALAMVGQHHQKAKIVKHRLVKEKVMTCGCCDVLVDHSQSKQTF